MKRRIGFGANGFKYIAPKCYTPDADAIHEDVYDHPDKIIYFQSEEHLQLIINE